RSRAHVAKPPATFVVEEHVGDRAELIRTAIRVERRSAEDVPADVPIEVPGYEQIQPSVVIVVEKSGGGRPAAGADSGLRGDIGERAIAAIAVKGVPAIRGDVEIRESIVVVIADCYAHAVVVPGGGDPRLPGYIRKAPVTILAVQPVPIRGIAPREVSGELCRIVQLPAVHQEDVEKSVVIVVEQSHAATHGF